MTTIINNSISGRYFCFEIMTEGDFIDISLKSRCQCSLEYQTLDKDELKALADFINKYLENN